MKSTTLKFENNNLLVTIMESSDEIILQYNFTDTLNETKSKTKSVKLKKDSKGDIKKLIKNLGTKKFSKDDVEDEVLKIKSKGEVKELIDDDGSFASSRIPIIDPRLAPKKTMDQTVAATRQTMNPILRGYRVYYGESVVRETDMSDAFGYEETKDMNGKETFKYFKETLGLDPIEAVERTKQQGKDPFGKKTKNAPKKIRKQKGFIDRMTLSEKESLEEMEKQQMLDMLENLLKNKSDDRDIYTNHKSISNNIKSQIKKIKKLADENNIDLKNLIDSIYDE